MNPAALPRLLRRPLFLLWLLVGTSTVLFLATFDFNFHGYRGNAVNVLMSLHPSSGRDSALHVLRYLSLCTPAVMGFLIGQTVQELYHTSFAWSLPGLRRSIAGQVALVGAVLAVLVVLGYRALGGSGNPVALAALALVWFLLGTGVEGSMLQLRLSATGLSSLAALVVAGVFVDPVYAWVTGHPWPGAAAALLLAAGILWWEYGTEAARRRPGIPTLPLLSTLSGSAKERYRREIRAHASGPGTPWTESLAGARTATWVRADAYESFGYRRGGGARVLWGTSALTVFFVGLFAFQSGLEVAGGRAEGLRFALATFLQTPVSGGGGHTPPYLLLGWFLGTVLWAYLATPTSLRLQSLPYPLSRSELAGVAYRSGLHYGIRFCLAAGVLFGAGTAILFLLGFRTGSLTALPGFVRALAVAFILVPFPLAFRDTGRLHSCSGRASNRIGLISVGSILATAGLVAVATRWLPAGLGHSGPLVEALVLAALIAASQLGYRRWLQGYFRKADLAC